MAEGEKVEVSGAQKFISDFLVGAIGFFYSSIWTIARILVDPIRSPILFRTRKKWTVFPLPAQVAMLMAFFILELFNRTPFQAYTGDSDAIQHVLTMSGAPWYHEIVAVGVIYVAADVLIMIAGRLLSKGPRHFQRDCDRLRYSTAALSATFAICLLATAVSVLWLRSALPEPAATMLAENALYCFGGAALIFGGISVRPLFLNFGSMLGGSRSPRGRFDTLAMYIAALALILAAIQAADGLAEKAYKMSALLFEGEVPEEGGDYRAPDLACIVSSSGKIAVTATIKNNGTSALIVAPNEIGATILPRDARGGNLKESSVPLKITSDYPIIIPAKSSTVVNLAGDLDLSALGGQAGNADYCKLFSTPDRGFSRYSELNSTTGDVLYVEEPLPAKP